MKLPVVEVRLKDKINLNVGAIAMGSSHFKSGVDANGMLRLDFDTDLRMVQFFSVAKEGAQPTYLRHVPIEAVQSLEFKDGLAVSVGGGSSSHAGQPSAQQNQGQSGNSGKGNRP